MPFQGLMDHDGSFSGSSGISTSPASTNTAGATIGLSANIIVSSQLLAIVGEIAVVGSSGTDAHKSFETPTNICVIDVAFKTYNVKSPVSGSSSVTVVPNGNKTSAVCQTFDSELPLQQSRFIVPSWTLILPSKISNVS